MYSRPKATETQEDLERLETEFKKHKSEKFKPAATVVSEKTNEDKSETEAEIALNEIQDQIANTFESIPSNSNVGKIVQKVQTRNDASQFVFNANKGFPKPQKRDLSLKMGNAGGSLFARSFKKLKVEPQTPTPEVISHSVSSSSTLLSENERMSIHFENKQRIEAMSQEEIAEERQNLITSLDPALIAFLKSRKKDIPSSGRASIQEQNQAAESMETNEIETTNEILSQPQSETWLNFNVIETNKLAWMKEMQAPLKLDKDKVFEARFDFDGWLLPYTFTEITEKNRALYHHGEDPSRPGYTLQELFQLSRSNIIQQKIVALNTIANLLALNSTAVYEGVLDLPLEQIFFVLRFCLDDNTPTVLNASIKAMRNLFHNRIDETCLDCLLGFGEYIQPILAIDNELEDDNTVNDQQLAETNLVKCLARTEILTRIKYIINNVCPNSPETIIYCLDILTRLARDSEFILNRVYKCENLVSSVIRHFVSDASVPPNSESPYGLPLVQAVKFLRVLAARSRKIAENLVEKHKIMDSLLVYLSSEGYSLNASGLKLQTEAFHLWNVFVQYNLAVGSFNVFIPVLAAMIDYHLKNTDVGVKTTFIRQGHVAALFNLIGRISQRVNLGEFNEILGKCAEKWLHQFFALDEFECGKLQIISAVLLAVPSTILEPLLIKLIDSRGFNSITTNLKNGSMLLNNYETFKSSPNLKTLEAAAWHTSEHVVPLMKTSSSLPLLASLAKHIEKSSNTSLKLAFVNHKNVKEYFTSLSQARNYFLASNWFTRVETSLIMAILKISVEISGGLADTGRFYEVAVKSLSVFSADQKEDIAFILARIVFSSKFYPSEVLLKNLTLEQRSESLFLSLNNLKEIFEVYKQVLGLEKNVVDFSSSLSLDPSVGNAIPIDWIYTPIVVLYTNQSQSTGKIAEDQQIFTVRNCLRWILIYETYFPGLARSVSPTERFCRLACVFLGSDSLFLVPEVHKLLELCLKNVLVDEQAINFSGQIEGLSSFQDFYVQLLEQYQGVSYGDVLFGNFILVPLAQRHSEKWRKTLWSEYSGIVEVFNVGLEEALCDLEGFKEPPEEDLSVLKCYRRALVSGCLRKHSVLYDIARHHVETYIKRVRDNKNKDI